jgi:hypothetical protein
MNSLEFLWESYMVNESLDRIQYYPYEETIKPFAKIIGRCRNTACIYESLARAEFKNANGDTIITNLYFFDATGRKPIINISFNAASKQKGGFFLTDSGDAANVVATVIKISLDYYVLFRQKMMTSFPDEWNQYISNGVVGSFTGSLTPKEALNPAQFYNGKATKRSRLYSIIFNKVIKDLCKQYNLPDMNMEFKSSNKTDIMTTEKPDANFVPKPESEQSNFPVRPERRKGLNRLVNKKV